MLKVSELRFAEHRSSDTFDEPRVDFLAVDMPQRPDITALTRRLSAKRELTKCL